MLLDPRSGAAGDMSGAGGAAPAPVSDARARKPYIRPDQMRSEELAALMRGFDAETVRRFSDFKKKR
jgi:hypothetical protein